MPLPWLLVPAFAATVAAVPPGARAVTVQLCLDPGGCPVAARVLGEHLAAQGLPLLDFDAVALAGPAGGDASAAWTEAWAAALALPDREHLERARSLLRTAPLTVPEDELFTLWLTLGAARLAAGEGEAADAAFRAAANVSRRRAWNLPRLPDEALTRYLDVAGVAPPSGRLLVAADHPAAQVWVDGRRAEGGELEVGAGWHRVSVERPGRRAAWVGEVVVPEGERTTVHAEVATDDAPAAAELAVFGALHGRAAPEALVEGLAAWGRSQGLATVRFVWVDEGEAATAARRAAPTTPPEEWVDGEGGRYAVYAAWLDVGAARLEARGPGPAALRTAASPDRVRLEVGVGYTRLQRTLATGPDPHDQLAVEVGGVFAVAPALAVDARVGAWSAAQPYYLYDGWTTHTVLPLAAGLRWTPGRSGVYTGAQGVVVVPFLLGAEAFAGWTWRPAPRARVGVELRGGWSDRGALVGARLTAGFAG